jgi:hypothetical protein
VSTHDDLDSVLLSPKNNMTIFPTESSYLPKHVQTSSSNDHKRIFSGLEAQSSIAMQKNDNISFLEEFSVENGHRQGNFFDQSSGVTSIIGH